MVIRARAKITILVSVLYNPESLSDLGGGVIKQRVAKQSSGKLTGFSTIIAYRKGKNAFFIHGYTKTEKDSIKTTDGTALFGGGSVKL